MREVKGGGCVLMTRLGFQIRIKCLGFLVLGLAVRVSWVGLGCYGFVWEYKGCRLNGLRVLVLTV